MGLPILRKRQAVGIVDAKVRYKRPGKGPPWKRKKKQYEVVKLYNPGDPPECDYCRDRVEKLWKKGTISVPLHKGCTCRLTKPYWVSKKVYEGKKGPPTKKFGGEMKKAQEVASWRVLYTMEENGKRVVEEYHTETFVDIEKASDYIEAFTKDEGRWIDANTFEAMTIMDAEGNEIEPEDYDPSVHEKTVERLTIERKAEAGIPARRKAQVMTIGDEFSDEKTGELYVLEGIESKQNVALLVILRNKATGSIRKVPLTSLETGLDAGTWRHLSIGTEGGAEMRRKAQLLIPGDEVRDVSTGETYVLEGLVELPGGEATLRNKATEEIRTMSLEALEDGIVTGTWEHIPFKGITHESRRSVVGQEEVGLETVAAPESVKRKCGECGKPMNPVEWMLSPGICGECVRRKHQEVTGQAPGEGKGVGGPDQGIGGTDTCVCPECGHKTEHIRGQPCADMTCPECDTRLIGEHTVQVVVGQEEPAKEELERQVEEVQEALEEKEEAVEEAAEEAEDEAGKGAAEEAEVALEVAEEVVEEAVEAVEEAETPAEIEQAEEVVEEAEEAVQEITAQEASKWRLYHGYDCNSETGFNNGTYLSGEYDDEDEARQAAKQHLSPYTGEWDNTDPDAYTVITGYYDELGNELSEEEYDSDNPNHSYSYQYVSVEPVYEPASVARKADGVDFLTGEDYPHVCQTCRDAVDRAADFLKNFGPDTDDSEAPMVYASDHGWLCGGRECVNEPAVAQVAQEEGAAEAVEEAVEEVKEKFEEVLEDVKERVEQVVEEVVEEVGDITARRMTIGQDETAAPEVAGAVEMMRGEADRLRAALAGTDEALMDFVRQNYPYWADEFSATPDLPSIEVGMRSSAEFQLGILEQRISELAPGIVEAAETVEEAEEALEEAEAEEEVAEEELAEAEEEVAEAETPAEEEAAEEAVEEAEVEVEEAEEAVEEAEEELEEVQTEASLVAEMKEVDEMIVARDKRKAQEVYPSEEVAIPSPSEIQREKRYDLEVGSQLLVKSSDQIVVIERFEGDQVVLSWPNGVESVGALTHIENEIDSGALVVVAKKEAQEEALSDEELLAKTKEVIEELGLGDLSDERRKVLLDRLYNELVPEAKERGLEVWEPKVAQHGDLGGLSDERLAELVEEYTEAKEELETLALTPGELDPRMQELIGTYEQQLAELAEEIEKRKGVETPFQATRRIAALDRGTKSEEAAKIIADEYTRKKREEAGKEVKPLRPGRPTRIKRAGARDDRLTE